MNILIMFGLFLIGIVAHELTHILVYWYLFNDWAKVRVSKTIIRIIPNQEMKDKEKKLFLGIPIIVGMVPIALYIFMYPYEGSLALIGYIISCGMDFWNLIKLEVKKYG